jgi:serine/threonine protein kinase
MRKVKAGGAGTIFLIQNLRARNRLGAVKVLHAQHAKGENPDSQRFLAEPKVLSLLKDLAIAPQLYSVTYDQPGEDAVLWYEMEWLDNYVTLRHHLGGKGKRLPRPELMTVVPLLVRGVARMHGRGVVHRDLTPENIMVAAGLRDLRLVDFGLVRFTAGLQGDDRDTFGRIDEVNEVIGKPSYCPPEQWLDGLNAAREPADWYAVGAIIWELVTGYPPYRRPEEVREAPRPQSELAEQLRREAALEEHLLECVCGLLDPQPETRARHAVTLARIFGS